MARETANVSDFLLHDQRPDSVALRMLQGDHTYGELRQVASQVANHFVRLGVAKGDRVLLIGENSLFWVASYLGILRAGLVCVPLPTSLSSQNLTHIRATTRAQVAFVQSSFARAHREALDGCHIVTDRDTLASSTGVPPPWPDVDPDDLAALMFTSGSTGTPRGVMVSHRNIIANTESIVEYLGLTEHDRTMAVLPFHYCFGTSLLHTHLRVGASLVVDRRFMYPETVLQRLIETACTGFAGVPSHFQILLRKSSLRHKTFPHLRYVQQAGGRLAPAFIDQLREALPRTKVFVMYGQTEATARLSYLPPDLLDAKVGSIGKGIPGVTLRVLDASGEQVPPGDVGEIVAEGQNVARGYWAAPEESSTTFRAGRLHTGDLATVDADGFIYLVDRVKDFVKVGGERVSCLEIESHLLEYADLVEAAVVAIPDDVLGEAVKAFVVTRAPADGEAKERLRLFCQERLPPRCVPKEIVVLQALPKNGAGKVLKAALRDVAGL